MGSRCGLVLPVFLPCAFLRGAPFSPSPTLCGGSLGVFLLGGGMPSAVGSPHFARVGYLWGVYHSPSGATVAVLPATLGELPSVSVAPCVSLRPHGVILPRGSSSWGRASTVYPWKVSIFKVRRPPSLSPSGVSLGVCHPPEVLPLSVGGYRHPLGARL